MPQIILAKKKRSWLPLAIIGGVAVVLVGGFVIWYVAIPSGETAADAALRAQNLAKYDSAQKGKAVVSERLLHTWWPPDRYRLELAYGEIFDQQGNQAEAIKHYEAALRSGGGDVEAYKALAEAYDAKGDNAKTREYYQKLVDYYTKKYEKNSNDKENLAPYYQVRLDAARQ